MAMGKSWLFTFLVFAVLGITLAFAFSMRVSADDEEIEALSHWWYVYGSDSNTDTKPSEIFCGKKIKGLKGTRICELKGHKSCHYFKGPGTLRRVDEATESSGQVGTCTAKARAGQARENVEIRGWITKVHEGDPYGCEDEFRFNVLLDHGWKPVAPNVYPINTLERISSAITPYNVIHFNKSHQLKSQGSAWGGRSGVIHVEVNGWGPARMCKIKPPNDWLPVFSDSLAHWPFNPRNPPSLGTYNWPLRVDDYVRVVGTLWEDTPHPGSGTGDQKTAKGCWSQGNGGRGWMEIHPVDFVARIIPPDQGEALEVITFCGRGEGANSAVTQIIHPRLPRPSRTATIGFEEVVDSTFTANLLPNEVLKRITVLEDGIRVTIQFLPRKDKRFKGYYRVFWKD